MLQRDLTVRAVLIVEVGPQRKKNEFEAAYVAEPGVAVDSHTAPESMPVTDCSRGSEWAPFG